MTAGENLIYTVQKCIERHRFYLIGYVIAFLASFLQNVHVVEDYYEAVFLVIISGVAGLFSWCYIAAKVLLLAIQ